VTIGCVLFKSLLKEIQAIEQVFGFANLNLSIRLHFGDGGFEFNRFIGRTAGIALVATGTGFIAGGAGSLNVTIREKTSTASGVNFEILFRAFSLKQPCLFESLKVPLNKGFVRGVTGSVEQGTAVFNASGIHVGGPHATKVVKGLDVDGVKRVNNGLRRNPLLLCRDGDGSAVLVGTRDHQNTIPQGSFKSKLNVRWEVTSGNVAEVQGSVGVGPCHAHQDVFIAH
jgi:hypothetical protein